ncbi:hypothetical protein AMS68_004223 [Peltaster fructicola]|uniref:Uncharacterized protein n=1 Tax=Peltaster fructicola TaxID=286661 RepID=A0A6H0XVJ1_9PEZI|nr:hypothetical protein AMS68_004223 [Peltaster fructicola]
MTLWNPAESTYTNWDVDTKRTFHAQYAVSDVLRSTTQVSNADIAALAKDLWDSLDREYGTAWASYNGARLLSVLYDDVANSFWASTIPLGPQKQLMINAVSTGKLATAWYRETKYLITGSGNNQNAKYHAEDGAYYNWETNAPQDRWEFGMYTGNMKILTYGSYSKDPNDTPSVVPLCSISRDPSCRAVAYELGVLEITRASAQGTKMMRRASNSTDWDVGDEDGSSISPQDVSAASLAFAPCRSQITAAACQSVLGAAVTSGPTAIVNLATYSSETDLVVITPTPSRITTLVTVSSTSSSPKSTLSCYLQNEDPDAGINTRYCICGSSTLPLMSIPNTAMATAACAYTTVPPCSTISVTTGFHSTITNTALCQVCSQVAAFGDSCTTMPNCTPLRAEANVTVGTVSPVIVGTLTGSALYTSISNALTSICPPVTQTTALTTCSGTAKIGGITYVGDESQSLAKDGEIIVSTQNSGYNETSLRNAAIKALALSAMNSASTQSNCWNETYKILTKRDLLGIEAPFNLSAAGQTGLVGRDHPYTEDYELQLCHMASVAQVNYYNRFWRLAPEPGPTDYILAEYNFRVSESPFFCDFIEALVAGLTVIEPEFAVEDVELGEAIEAVCGETESGH